MEHMKASVGSNDFYGSVIYLVDAAKEIRSGLVLCMWWDQQCVPESY